MALLLHCLCLNGTWKIVITVLWKSHVGAFFKEIIRFLVFNFIPREREELHWLNIKKGKSFTDF